VTLVHLVMNFMKIIIPTLIHLGSLLSVGKKASICFKEIIQTFPVEHASGMDKLDFGVNVKLT